MQQRVERLDRGIYFSLCGLALSLFSTVAGSSIFLGLAIALFFVRAYFRRDDLWEPFKPYRRFVYAYGLFVLAMLVSALFSGDIRHGVGLVVSKQGYYVMPCVIIMSIIRDKDKLIVLAKLALVSLLANNVCLFWKAWHLFGTKTIRIDGLVGFLALAAVFSVTIPILYLGTAYFKGIWRWICFVSGVSCIAANLFTGTRSGWLTSAAVLLVIAVLYTKSKMKLLIGLLVAVACMGAVFASSPQLTARLESMRVPEKQISVTDRFSMWHSAANIWKDYPVLGIGVGQYGKAYQTKYCLPDSYDYKNAPKNRHDHPHSNFMLILAEAGVVGEASFLFFLGVMIWFAFHGWRRTNDAVYLALLSVLLGTQLQGIMDTNIAMTVVSKAYWFFIGLALQMIGVNCAWDFTNGKTVEYGKDE